MEKFHHFLYASHFILETDQKLLEAILSKSLNQATPRLQGILIRVFQYHFTVHYIPSVTNQLANCLTRLGGQKDTIQLPKLHLYQITNQPRDVFQHKLHQCFGMIKQVIVITDGIMIVGKQQNHAFGSGSTFISLDQASDRHLVKTHYHARLAKLNQTSAPGVTTILDIQRGTFCRRWFNLERYQN